MRRALSLAAEAENAGEIPIGAVVVQHNAIIAEAFNQTISLSDPSAHAEVLALRAAAQRIDNYRLTEATLYVTVEPCLMCAGCLLNARLQRLVFGAREERTGAIVSINEALNDRHVTHKVNITEGVLAGECARLMRDFFAERR